MEQQLGWKKYTKWSEEHNWSASERKGIDAVCSKMIDPQVEFLNQYFLDSDQIGTDLLFIMKQFAIFSTLNTKILRNKERNEILL